MNKYLTLFQLKKIGFKKIGKNQFPHIISLALWATM